MIVILFNVPASLSLYVAAMQAAAWRHIRKMGTSLSYIDQKQKFLVQHRSEVEVSRAACDLCIHDKKIGPLLSSRSDDCASGNNQAT